MYYELIVFCSERKLKTLLKSYVDIAIVYYIKYTAVYNVLHLSLVAARSDGRRNEHSEEPASKLNSA